eukprot:TRINITY_DN2842_c0_g1_i1.p1 TRINITY_DN2842_c0_g1~~TRINITY_DN2842_c0_g1_i1.p1  ORF type:complete len:226 (+),score=36.75 TRINITY_DN2842_c0_g1_i1:48-725(+)
MEIEIKLSIPVEEVGNVKKYLIGKQGMSVKKEMRQVSYFYDADDALTKEGISLRLREVESEGNQWWEVTLKGPGEQVSSAVCRLEEERKISKPEAMEIKAHKGCGLLECLYHSDFVQKCRDLIKGKNLVLCDSFENKREVIGPFLRPEIYIELDTTTFQYKGSYQTDAEIECEVPSNLIHEASHELKGILHKAVPSLPEVDDAVGKRTRMKLFKSKIDSRKLSRL